MAESPSTLMLMLRLALSLGLVLAMVGAVTWALRRRGMLGPTQRGASGRLEVLDRKSLGKHASLVVARVGGVAVLVGVTDQNVTVLSEDPRIDAAWTAPEPDAGLTGDVADLERMWAAGDTDDHTTMETRRTGFPVEAPAVADASTTTSGMSFVEALRELTVRRS